MARESKASSTPATGERAEKGSPAHVVRRELPPQRSAPAPPPPVDVAALLAQYGCGPIPLTGRAEALYERHLAFDNVIDQTRATPREKFEAFARSVRDVLSQRWV